VTDILGLVDQRTPGASLYGATPLEKRSVILGKLAHFSLLLAVPCALHGWHAVWPAAVAYSVVQGVVLSATFAVSHNIPETKGAFKGADEVAKAVRDSQRLLCRAALLPAQQAWQLVR
jgi:hypothetical protein